MMAQLNDDKVTIWPDLDQIVQRNTHKSECGDMAITFTIQDTYLYDPKAFDELFVFRLDSFIIKKLPRNAYYLIGEYKISY